MRVQCPGCKRIQHETTECYQPNVLVNGSFVKLTEKYRNRGWNCFDEGGGNYSTTTASMMLCPSCGMSLAPGGRLIIAEDVVEVRQQSQAEKNQAIIDFLDFDDGADPEAEFSILELENPLECKFCGKVCANRTGLASHMRNKHKELSQ